MESLVDRVAPFTGGISMRIRLNQRRVPGDLPGPIWRVAVSTAPPRRGEVDRMDWRISMTIVAVISCEQGISSSRRCPWVVGYYLLWDLVL